MNIIKHAPNLCDLDMIQNQLVGEWGWAKLIPIKQVEQRYIYIYTHTRPTNEHSV